MHSNRFLFERIYFYFYLFISFVWYICSKAKTCQNVWNRELTIIDLPMDFYPWMDSNANLIWHSRSFQRTMRWSLKTQQNDRKRANRKKSSSSSSKSSLKLPFEIVVEKKNNRKTRYWCINVPSKSINWETQH